MILPFLINHTIHGYVSCVYRYQYLKYRYGHKHIVRLVPPWSVPTGAAYRHRVSTMRFAIYVSRYVCVLLSRPSPRGTKNETPKMKQCWSIKFNLFLMSGSTICFTMCLCISPGFDGHGAPKMKQCSVECWSVKFDESNEWKHDMLHDMFVYESGLRRGSRHVCS